MNQLAEFIDWWSVGNAVIVAGDTNMRYTSAGENIREFLSRTGMTDPWIQGTQGGIAPGVGPANVYPKGSETNGCEVVDEIFYRSEVDLDLRLAGYSNEDSNFLDTDGIPLSDHRPIAAWFDWQEKSSKFVLIGEGSRKCIDVANISNRPQAVVNQWDCLDGTTS